MIPNPPCGTAIPPAAITMAPAGRELPYLIDRVSGGVNAPRRHTMTHYFLIVDFKGHRLLPPFWLGRMAIFSVCELRTARQPASSPACRRGKGGQARGAHGLEVVRGVGAGDQVVQAIEGLLRKGFQPTGSHGAPSFWLLRFPSSLRM